MSFMVAWVRHEASQGDLIDLGLELYFVGCFFTTSIFCNNLALAFKIANWTILNPTAWQTRGGSSKECSTYNTLQNWLLDCLDLGRRD